MANKSRNPGYIKNDHWVVSQRSGKVIRASEARKEWTGLIVAKDEWEPRQPQDFVRAKEDHQEAKGIVNTEPTDSFVVTGFTGAGLTDIPTGTF